MGLAKAKDVELYYCSSQTKAKNIRKKNKIRGTVFAEDTFFPFCIKNNASCCDTVIQLKINIKTNMRRKEKFENDLLNVRWVDAECSLLQSGLSGSVYLHVEYYCAVHELCLHTFRVYCY